MNFLRRFLLVFSSCLDATSFHSLSVRWCLIIRCLIAQVMRPEVQCELRLTIVTTGRVCGLFLQAVSTDLHTASAHRLCTSSLGIVGAWRDIPSAFRVHTVATERWIWCGARGGVEKKKKPRSYAGAASADDVGRDRVCTGWTPLCTAIQPSVRPPYFHHRCHHRHHHHSRGSVWIGPVSSGLAWIGPDSMVVMRDCAARLQPHAVGDVSAELKAQGYPPRGGGSTTEPCNCG